MKKLLIIITLCSIFILRTKAQDPGYTGLAKNQVNYFWENAKSTADGSTALLTGINNMKYAIAKTKEKDPSYSTAAMEAELKKFNDKLREQKVAASMQYNGDKTQVAPVAPISNDPAKLLDALFKETNLSIGSSSELPKAKGMIELYKEKANKLLTLDYADAKLDDIRMLKANVNGKLAVTQRELDKLDDRLSDYNDQQSFEYLYYTLQYHLAFWDAAKQVFSEESSYVTQYQKVNAAVQKLGSLDQLASKASANNAEKIKNNKLPVAVMKDAAAEKMMMDAFNKRYSAEYKGTAIKAVILQSDWHAVRNELTSIITGRQRQFAIAYKGNDGKCYLISSVYLYQEYNGSSYTNTNAIYAQGGNEMLCENVY